MYANKSITLKIIIEIHKSNLFEDPKTTATDTRKIDVVINNLLKDLKKEIMESRKAKVRFQLFFFSSRTGILQKTIITG